MKALRIKLSSPEDVKAFVSIVQNYPCDMFFRDKNFRIDAKSVLGLFSLNLSSPLDLEIHSSSCDDLIEDLSPFTV